MQNALYRKGIKTSMRLLKCKKRMLSAIVLCMVAALLSACSSEKIIHLLSADGNVKDTSDGSDGLKMTYTEDETKHHQLGDTFEVMNPTQENPENIGFECTVMSAEYYPSVSDEEIDQTKLADSVEYYINEEPELVEKSDYSQYGMVMCKIKIQNINMSEDYHAMNCDCVSVDADKNVHEISLPVYFDARDRSEKDGEFYHCKMPVGEEREIVVGWLLKIDQIPLDTLQIQVPYGADDEYIHYVSLNLQSEGEQ